MSSGSPRSRINQFFTSRKKTFEKDPKNSFLGSPKGSLVGFLVKSPDATSHSPPISPSHRPGPVKRNLTLEIGLNSDNAKKPSLASPESSGDCTKDKGAGDGVTAEAREEDEGSGSGSGSGGCNLELKEFANDFLSLYCSDLPSALQITREAKGKKRDGSPFLLSACSKKHCLSDTRSDEENNTSNKGCYVTEIHNKISSISVKHAESGCQFSNKNDESDTSCVSLNIFGKTPDSNLIKGGFGALSSSVETSKSGSRSSRFSPGEEFWNEAIEVADGLVVPVERLQENSEVSIIERPYKLTFEDALSRVAPQNAEYISKLEVGKSVAQNVSENAFVKPKVMVSEGNNELPALIQKNGVSPLPIKHFDFVQVENNGTDKSCNPSFLERANAVTNSEAGLIDSSSVNDKKLCDKSYKNGMKDFSFDLKQNLNNIHLLNGELNQHVPVASKFSRNVGKFDSLVQVNGANPSTEGFSSNGSISALHDRIDAELMEARSTSEPFTVENNTPASSIPLSNRLQLSNWLPSELVAVYSNKGITKLYPWQVDCLLVDGVLERRNLVYCASTSAGKSFVAEILMIRRVIATGKMAILVLPYVSICAEKAQHLNLLLEPLHKNVCSFYGNQGGGSLPKDTSVAVCTIEKANSLINRLLEDGRLSEVGIIIIDELHMVGDQYRGYLLELLLTKLRYAIGDGISESSSEEDSANSGKTDATCGLQIVGMSATMPNLAAVADWLKAALYQTNFRPVPLEEFIKVGNTIFNKKMDAIRVLPKAADLGGKDPDHIVELCNEVIQEGHSVLFFCSSRKGCEITARHISRFLKKCPISTREFDCEWNDCSSAIEALRRCPSGLDPIFEETLPTGVAYHHAGLTVEEREIIEMCYRKGIVRVLTATSTLAAGVNLPARRVIFRQPRIGRDFIDGTRYRQMAGRAGRTGIDTLGESILICKNDEAKKVTAILNDNCPPLQSCLSEDKNGMTHAILEVVAGGIVQSASDIHRYVKCTLLNSTRPFEDVVASAQDSLRWLCHKKFIEWNEETGLYSSTPLGRAAFGSSLTPEESLVVLNDLSRAREGFVLASDLHLVYLVTPINVEVEPDWELYYQRFMELSPLDQTVGNRVGIVEPFLMRMAHCAPISVQERPKGRNVGLHDKLNASTAVKSNDLFSNEQNLRIARRFYVTLMLSRLVQEVPIADVCEAFKAARGMIQALQENAGRFASMVSLFCERLGWHDLEGLVAKFQNRVSFGVRAEIVELTTIPHVKGSRARALYKAGLRTPLAIAEASISDIAKALFESSTWSGEEGSAKKRMHMVVAKKIKNASRKIILDKAEEARVAAFSAFKSLGIHVPHISRPTLPNSTENSPHGSATSPKSAWSSYENLVSENKKVTGNSAADDKTGMDNMPEEIIVHKLNKTIGATIVTAENINITEELQHGHNIPTSELIDKPSLTDGICVDQLFDNCLTVRPMCAYFPTSGPSIEVNIVKDEPNKKKEIEQPLTIHRTGSSFDKGPHCASAFPGGFDSFLEHWGLKKEFYFDVHYSKMSEQQSSIQFEVFGLAICWENSPVYYVNLIKDLLPSGKKISHHHEASNIKGDIIKDLSSCDIWTFAKSRWKKLGKIMANYSVRKFSWSLKTQIQALKAPCVSLQRFSKLGLQQDMLNDTELIATSYILLPSITVNEGIDLRLMTWSLWPDEESKSTPSLEKLVKRRLSNEAAAAANREGRWRNQMRRAAHDGCCRRVAQTRALVSVMWKLVVSENLVDVLTRIENPLVKVLADMEVWGVGVDMEACLRARQDLMRKLKELEKDAHNLAGIPFSLYSTADIAHVLFTCLKLPIPSSSRKGKLHPSTDKKSLSLLRGQHPIISVIKEHRTLAKLLNSTLGSICSRARLCINSQRYLVRGYWLQTSTATGRLSMEEPNLQCVEHMVIFTTCHPCTENFSTSDNDQHQIVPRDFIIPTQENWLLLTADYSQIELRLLAHFSKDSSLIQLLSKPDGDCFTMIAARWTGKLECTISSKEREQTKKLVYGILYGMGPNTLAEQLDCSSREAAEKIQQFKSSFPGVSAWLNEAIASCCSKGYVETLMGRRRFLSKINFGNNKEKSKAQRQAVNSICQGSAADVIKIAMLKIHTIIAGEVLPDSITETLFSILRGQCRIVLQVHDELVLEVDHRFVREAAILLQESMEGAASLSVPLCIKMKIGRTWGSQEPFIL